MLFIASSLFSDTTVHVSIVMGTCSKLVVFVNLQAGCDFLALCVQSVVQCASSVAPHLPARLAHLPPYFLLRYPGGSCLTRCRCDELPCPLLSWLSARLRALCPELQGSYKEGKDVLGFMFDQQLNSEF